MLEQAISLGKNLGGVTSILLWFDNSFKEVVIGVRRLLATNWTWVAS